MSTILVVDDDADIRLLLRVDLDAQGHRILEASNGEEAFVELEREPVDIMLLDIMMPVLDGVGVLRRLAGRPSAPVVVITGHGNLYRLAELLELGAIDVVEKPFRDGHLVGLIDAILQVDEEERQEYRLRRLAQLRGTD